MKYSDYHKKLEGDQEYLQAQEELRFAFNFGDAVLRARLEQGWSQSELARRVGTRQANISRIESGVANPTMRLMQAICQTLDLDLLTVPRTTAPDQYLVSPGNFRKTASFESWLMDILSKSEGKGAFRLCLHKLADEHGASQYITEFKWNRIQSMLENPRILKTIAERGPHYWVEYCEEGSDRWKKISELPSFDEPEHVAEKT